MTTRAPEKKFVQSELQQLRNRRIWIVCTGEPTPADGGFVRLYRAGQLALELAERGYDVTWWASTFSHREKAMRKIQQNPLPVKDGLVLRFLPALGYKRHVSAQRLADHAYGAAAFVRQAGKLPPPAAIYSAYPTVELTAASAHIAGRAGAGLCVDVRDLWPDIFDMSLSPAMTTIAALPIRAYRAVGRYALRRADAVVSITEPMLQWGLAMAGRPARGLDAVIPFPHSGQAATPEEMAAATSKLEACGLDLADGRARVLYCGMVTRTTDVTGIIAAADQLQKRNSDVQIVVLGAGDRHLELASAASSHPNIYVGGWVGIPTIAAVAAHSAAGLLPYGPLFDFEMSMPNKVGEYLYYGLPIITSLRVGPACDLIQRERAGVLYQFQDGASLADAIHDCVTQWHARGACPDTRLQSLGTRLFGTSATIGRLGDLIESLSQFAVLQPFDDEPSVTKRPMM